MSLRASFARLPVFLRGIFALGLIFFVALAVGIAIDAWVIQQGEPVPGERVVHLRHYVLPVIGFAASVFLLLRRALPAAHTSLRILAYGGGIGKAFPDFVRSVLWFLAAVAAFAIASSVQQNLFGFFLPP